MAGKRLGIKNTPSTALAASLDQECDLTTRRPINTVCTTSGYLPHASSSRTLAHLPKERALLRSQKCPWSMDKPSGNGEHTLEKCVSPEAVPNPLDSPEL